METFHEARAILKVAAVMAATAFLMLNYAVAQHTNPLVLVWALLSSRSPFPRLGLKFCSQFGFSWSHSEEAHLGFSYSV